MATSIMPGFFPLASGNDTTPASEATVNAWIAQQMQRWVDFIAPLGLTAHTPPAGQASFPNYTTVPIPATGNITTDIGYNYYRFSDALQVSEPVFIKITWRVVRRGTTTHVYNLGPIIETGVCDASGTFSITTGGLNYTHAGTNFGAWNTTPQVWYGCYTGDYLYIGFGRLSSNPAAAPTGFYLVERGKGINGGSPARPGILVASRRWNGTTATSGDGVNAPADLRYLRRSDGGVSAVQSAYRDSIASHADGANNWVVRHSLFDGGPVYFSGYFVYVQTEYAVNSMFTMPKLGGGTQTVIAMPPETSIAATFSGTSISSCLVRWE